MVFIEQRIVKDTSSFFLRVRVTCVEANKDSLISQLVYQRPQALLKLKESRTTVNDYQIFSNTYFVSSVNRWKNLLLVRNNYV